MKLIQSLYAAAGPGPVSGATPVASDEHSYIDSDFHSGIQHIYFEITAFVTSGGSTGKIELYDCDTSQVICTLTVTETEATRKISGDLLGVIPYKHKLCVRAYVSSGGGYINNTSPKILIEQDDATFGRKTATYYSLGSWAQAPAGTTWQGSDVWETILRLGNFDGTIKAYFEAWLRLSAGTGNAEARLYDITADEVVAGSTISTSQTTDTRVRSGELTLQSAHTYRFQIRHDTAGGGAIARLRHIIIQTTGFTKCEAKPTGMIDNGFYVETQTGLWPPILQLKRSAINATSEVYTFHSNFVFGADGGETGSLQIENITKTTDLVTKNDIPVDEFHNDYDEVTPSTDDDEYETDVSANEFMVSMGEWGFLVVLTEAFPSVGETLPDPSMPTGYHCFMSQFIRNCLTGYVPFLTPDGVNRCW